MKQRILTMAATVAAVMILTGVSVKAQSGARIQANVPFDFVAGDAKLKAGDYSVTRIARNAFLLRSADLKSSVVVQAPIAIGQRREGSPARLVFKRYGSEHFLAQVWSDARGEGRQLYSSKSEERLAKQGKKNNETARLVEVLAQTK
jgi:hypothetical protein